jgi:hypothetical protein
VGIRTVPIAGQSMQSRTAPSGPTRSGDITQGKPWAMLSRPFGPQTTALNTAWHEVPGKSLPQKSRPVGYGVIVAGVCTDSMVGATKFRREIPLGLAAPGHTVPYGTALRGMLTQALRAWLAMSKR